MKLIRIDTDTYIAAANVKMPTMFPVMESPLSPHESTAGSGSGEGVLKARMLWFYSGSGEWRCKFQRHTMAQV